MNSFNEHDQYRFFRWKDYYTAWQELIFGTPDITKAPIALRQSVSDRLKSQIQNLWQSFNDSRDKLRKDYATDKSSMHSYLAAFLLPNIQRVFALLTEPGMETAFRKIFSPGKEEVVIADFGSGPLSATLGFLLAADFWQCDLGKVKIEIQAVERSALMLSTGYKLLQYGFGERINVSLSAHTSPLKIAKAADAVLAANVFNELPVKHRLATLESLWKISAKGGIFLLLEPGQDQHARNLSSMRNLFIRQYFKEVTLLGPCRQMINCPLSADSPRNDWCWFSHRWEMPEAMALIDRISGLEHWQLNYSYLLLLHARPGKPHKGWLIISDLLSVGKLEQRKKFTLWLTKNLISGNPQSLEKMPADQIGKFLLCSDQGELHSLIGEKKFFTGLKRGEKLNAIPQNVCLCKEKN